MQRRNKAYLIIMTLLLTVCGVLFFKKPLFYALLITNFIGFILIEHKQALGILIKLNVAAVSKTLMLMFLISITLPVMMASGVLPALIYYVSNLMVGHNLLIAAFVIATILSMMLGTAIGTLTILVPLFLSISIQSGIYYPLVVGALISGAYIGDRASPLSSGLHLVSSVTQTDYQDHIGLLIKSSIVPYIVSLLLFYSIGKQAPISVEMLSNNHYILDYFKVSPYFILPLIVMIVLLVLRIKIISVLEIVFFICFGLALYNGVGVNDLIQYMLNGYRTAHIQLSSILITSGFFQMTNVLYVILLSAILNSILEADHLMQFIISPFVKNIKTPASLLRRTGLLSLVLCMVTCSQAMTAMVTGKYMVPYFDDLSVSRKYLVMAISNVGLNVVALIPWNVNGLMIKQLTGVAPLSYTPFAFFLLLITFFTLFIYPSWIFRSTQRFQNENH